MHAQFGSARMRNVQATNALMGASGDRLGLAVVNAQQKHQLCFFLTSKKTTVRPLSIYIFLGHADGARLCHCQSYPETCVNSVFAK